MSQPSHSIRRQPTQARAQHTVDAILEAAAQVFEEHGFEAGTTERIVARAGVSVGSMYQYFPNKSALLVALAERYCAEVQVSQAQWLDWLQVENPGLDEGLRAFVDWLVAAHAVRPRLRCLLFEERPPQELSAQMHVAHAATIDGLEGWLSGRVSRPRVAAILLQQTVPHLIHQLVLHPQPEMSVQVAAQEVFRLARAYLEAAAVGQSVDGPDLAAQHG